MILSSIKACISGSAALPVEVQEKFEKVTGGKLVEGYGLTETSPVTHANFVWAERTCKRISWCSVARYGFLHTWSGFIRTAGDMVKLVKLR